MVVCGRGTARRAARAGGRYRPSPPPRSTSTDVNPGDSVYLIHNSPRIFVIFRDLMIKNTWQVRTNRDLTRQVIFIVRS